eukprot:5874274-Amphidinium_carterae.1
MRIEGVDSIPVHSFGAAFAGVAVTSLVANVTVPALRQGQSREANNRLPLHGFMARCGRWTQLLDHLHPKPETSTAPHHQQ